MYLYCKLYFDSMYSREIQCKACLHCCLHSYLCFKDLSWLLDEMHSPKSVTFPSIPKKARTGTCQPALVEVEKQVTDLFASLWILLRALLWSSKPCSTISTCAPGWKVGVSSHGFPSSDGAPRRRIHRKHSSLGQSLHQPLLSKLPPHFGFLYF